MVRLLLAYVAAALAMATLDAAWLDLVMKQIVASSVGELLAARTNYVAAALFYLLYVGGVVLFAIQPALRSHNLLLAFALGAALGFFAYMTYDLTNMATLKVWPLRMAAIDIAWGAFVTGIAALAGYSAARAA